MAKKPKKIEVKEPDFLDLIAASGIVFDQVETNVNKKKDVKKTLCQHRDFVRVLRDEESVNNYFDQCVKNGIVAVDTETNNSLDIHDNIMVGLCLYTPFNRPVYIPVGHLDKYTKQLAEGQVSKEFLKSKIELLKNLKLVFHNAKFDINVIRTNFDIHLPIFWDTLIAAKVMDENRLSNGLKSLYVEKIDPCLVDYHVTTFFDENIYADIEDFGLYSAIDSYDTYKLYKCQERELSTVSMSKLKSLLEDLEFKVTEVCADMEWRGFTFNEDLCKNYIYTETEKLKSLGDQINELLEPFKEAILNWQYEKVGRGMVNKIDPETGFPVKVKKKVTQGNYTKWVDTDEIVKIPDPYVGVKMEWPVKLTSPDQVLCLLNCILGIEVNSTIIDDLKATGYEIANLIGKYRHINHNLTSFFLPYIKISKNGKIYASFNQMGDEEKTVKTGRFSSKEPNLQQLPARQGEDGARLMFGASFALEDRKMVDGRIRLYYLDEVETIEGWKKARDLVVGNTLITNFGSVKVKTIYSQEDDEHRVFDLIGSGEIVKIKRPKSLEDNDFSAQEPRVMSSLSGERELIDGYNLRTPEFPKGKDFYAMLASSAFKMDYWDCTEFDRDGKFQQEGKNRRQQGKVIQLGVSYGMGARLLSENINAKKKPGETKMTIDDATEMMTTFFGKFKTLKTWKDYNMARLEQFGYMETADGRRRRLYDTWLPDYDVKVYEISKIEDIFFNMDIKVVLDGKVYYEKSSIKEVNKQKTLEVIRDLDSIQNTFKKKEKVEVYRENPLIEIKSNGGYKSRPKTQATNFVIQGGGAGLTKKAMVAIYNHPDRKKYGINILAPVHDEIMIESYTEYRKEALNLLATCMANSAEGLYEVKMCGDGVIETSWNFEHFTDKVQKEFKKNGGDVKAIYDHYREISKETLDLILSGEVDVEVDRLIPSSNCIKN